MHYENEIDGLRKQLSAISPTEPNPSCQKKVSQLLDGLMSSSIFSSIGTWCHFGMQMDPPPVINMEGGKRRPEDFCLSISAHRMNEEGKKQDEDDPLSPASTTLKNINMALKGATVDDMKKSTKEMIQRDRHLFQEGFIERMNRLTPSQLYNIVRGCSQLLGLSDPAKLVEVTERLGMAIMNVAKLQGIVKVGVLSTAKSIKTHIMR